MDRRTFLKYSGISAVVLAAGIGGYLSYLRADERKLAERLAPLLRPRFKEAAASRESSTMIAELMAKGVIDENDELHSSVVQDLARTDEVVRYNGRYYTQTEIELYSLAYLLGEKYSLQPE